MPRRPNGRAAQSSTPPSSSDSSTSTSEGASLITPNEDRRSTAASPLSRDVLESLNSTNVEVYEILEEVRRLRELRDIASSRLQEFTRISGHEGDEPPEISELRALLGPSHSAIDLTPFIDTSEIDQLSNIVDDLLERNPGSWFPQHEHTTPDTNVRRGGVPTRQRSRSNVETQTASAQNQGRAQPRRRPEIGSFFREDMRNITRFRDDRHQANSQDVASTSLGRRVAARAASNRSRAQTNTVNEGPPRSTIGLSSRAVARGSFIPMRNTLGIPMGNPGEFPTRTIRPSMSRQSLPEDDHDFRADLDLQTMLSSLRSEGERRETVESSETETDDDVRFRRRFLSSASADNSRAARRMVGARDDNIESFMDTYRTYPIMLSPGTITPPPEPLRRTQATTHDAPQQTSTRSSSIVHAASQTDDSHAHRSPSPASLSDGGSSGNNSGGPYREVVETVQGLRSTYQVRRHLNARGEEQVHQISGIEHAWDDPVSYNDSYTLAFPSPAIAQRRSSATERRNEMWQGPRNRERLRSRNERVEPSPGVFARPRVSAFTQVTPLSSGDGSTSTHLLSRPSASSLISSSSANSVGTRRRGWARLNADGDEIPTDEEEEIERQRTEQRLRNGDPSYSVANVNTMRARLEYLAPTTRSIFNYGLEDEDSFSNPGLATQVRLNLPIGQARRRVQQLASEASEGRSEKTSGTGAEVKEFGTDVPYRLSPLPVPTPTKAASSRSSSVSQKFVSRQSELAAR